MASQTLFPAPGGFLPFDVEQPGSPKLTLRDEDKEQAGDSLPLLSCIGVGMALGGLLSAHWANRGDKQPGKRI